MILIPAPGFGDLTALNEQLPEAVRMALGATVSRIRIELIFRGCWNLITPMRAAQHRRRNSGHSCDGADRAATIQPAAGGLTTLIVRPAPINLCLVGRLELAPDVGGNVAYLGL